MKTKQFLYAASLLLLTACSSDDVQQSQPVERIPVQLSYSTVQAVDTRAAAALNLNDEYIASGQSVHVQIANVGSTDWESYTYTTGDNGAMTAPTSPKTPLYPTDDTNIKILAWYPADAPVNGFEVQADQSSGENYQKSDLMFSNDVTDQAKQVDPVALTFVHKMAKIVVNVTSGVGVSKIQSVTLKNVHRTLTTFDQSDGTVVTKLSDDVSGTAGDVYVVTDGNEEEAHGAAVIPAQTIDGALLEITTNIGTATYTVDNKAFVSGHKYTLNIRVSRTTVNTTTAIGAWDADGSVTINSQGSPFMTFTVGGATFKMVYVEGSESDVALTWDDQTTGASYSRHPVKVKGISDYYIGQTEVTNGLWYAVMESNPPVWSPAGQNNGQPNNGDTYPVAYVSFEQIMGADGTGTAAECFIKKLNVLAASQLPSGWKFVLPSEVQWQYAAIGGKYTNGYTYSGSSMWGDSAWNGDNSAVSNQNQTHPVATKPANELGIYDMSGNVWEWCRDLYATVTDNQELAKDYVGTSGTNRVIRGGDWSSTSAGAAYLYPSFRYPYAPATRSCFVGFRLALQFNP